MREQLHARPDVREFADPSGIYRPIPFWFWNGDMEEAEIDRQLREMKDKGVLEAFIHARKGLTIPYFSETWFDRVGFTIRKASEYGMRMWLYDEDNWPSGYAGGRVIKANPDYRAKNLAWIQEPVGSQPIPLPEGKLVAVVASSPDYSQIEDVTSSVTDGKLEWTAPGDGWSINFFMERYGHWKAAYTEDYYVDLLNPDCVREFIRVTHEEYYRRFGDEFGKTIAGIFTDEPGFYANLWGTDDGTNTWTGSFLSEFQRMKGYDLKPHLLSLFADAGEYQRIRADYYDVLSVLFRDNYFKQIYDWCIAHKVESIGHITIEEELKYNARMVGEFYRSMEYLTIPGVDEIGQLRTNPNEITPKLGSSAAHVFERERCMSETFGVYGWKLTLEEMKKTTDLQYARGVNLYVPHAFYYSIEGERKEECPPSEFWQNIWWKYFKHYADYVGRLSYMNSLGRHVADIAVYYPLPGVWAEITPTDTTKPDEIDARFKEVSNLLLSNQRDFDYLGDDAILAAEISDGKLRIGGEEFGVFILPSTTAMNVDVMAKLAEFCHSGGVLIVCGEMPGHAVISGTDEELQDIFYALEEEPGAGRLLNLPDAREIIQVLKTVCRPDVSTDPIEPAVNYLHRRAGDTDIYFLANRSPEQSVFTARFRCTSIPQFWNAETGEISDAHVYTQSAGCTSVPMHLSGYGSAFVVFSPQEDRPHLVATNLPQVTEVKEQSVTGLVRRTGAYYAEVAMGDSVKRVGASVLHLPDTIQLDGVWHLRAEAGSPFDSELANWTDQGMPDYSGSVTYSKDFELSPEYVDHQLLLELGTVHETAEVHVNGKPAGIRLWRPYTLDIGALVQAGANRLEVIVTNTLANRFTEEKLPSGLLGTVRVVPLEEVLLED